MAVAVLDKYGNQLMMTDHYGKVRHMIKDGRAKIHKHRPFAIQLTYDVEYHVQKTEICSDLGYRHNGLSVKSESSEYVSKQSDMLDDEKNNYDSCRKYRRTRRGQKTRHREERRDNRKASKKKGRIAPSLLNTADRQIDLIVELCEVAPITDVYVEVGQFDTQVLQAVEEGKPIPEGLDYQYGPTYGADTLRAAVFQRDNYKCVFCGRSAFEDGAILHEHHAYYWKGRHGDRLDELATCCEKCHTTANHQPGGKLWGYDKGMADFRGAAFMNTIKWYIYNKLKEKLPNVNIHITYGAITHRNRLSLGLEDFHVNDAYSMGEFHPKKRAEFEFYQKNRRNNRVLEKFYDAQYIDIRDGKKKPGKELGCERTKRKEPRNGPKSLRKYRGEKISDGRRSIRRQRYDLQPGDIVVYNNAKYEVAGSQNKGTFVKLRGLKKPVSVKKVRLIRHLGGWRRLT